MKVVQVVFSLDVGGSESLGRDIAVGLHKRGFTSAVCALERGGPIQNDLLAEGIRYEVIGRKPKERFSAMKRIYRFFKELDPDIVHTHHLYELFYSLPGALLAGARVIHTEHEYFSISNPKARFLLRMLSPFCRRFTGVGTEVSNYLMQTIGIPERKISTIFNGIDLRKFSKPDRSKTEKLKNPGEKLIGIVARLEKVKDHETILVALTKIRKQNQKVSLALIGDGQERPNLERRVNELGLEGQVRFLGTRRDIPQLLSQMDIFVLCSVAEGLPISILEAMAAGIPVVATSVGNVPEVIIHGETGILVKPRNPDELAGAVLQILSDESLAGKLSQKAQELIRQKYGLDKMLDEYANLYHSIAEA